MALGLAGGRRTGGHSGQGATPGVSRAAGSRSPSLPPADSPVWDLLTLREGPSCRLLHPLLGPPLSIHLGSSARPQLKENSPFQARLCSRFCMVRVETISASNECFSLCPCPLKCLMNVFCARVAQGVCPRVSAATIRGAVGLPRPAHWGRGSKKPLPGPPRPQAQRPVGSQAPLCKHRDPGALGAPE